MVVVEQRLLLLLRPFEMMRCKVNWFGLQTCSRVGENSPTSLHCCCFCCCRCCWRWCWCCGCCCFSTHISKKYVRTIVSFDHKLLLSFNFFFELLRKKHFKKSWWSSSEIWTRTEEDAGLTHLGVVVHVRCREDHRRLLHARPQKLGRAWTRRSATATATRAADDRWKEIEDGTSPSYDIPDALLCHLCDPLIQAGSWEAKTDEKDSLFLARLQFWHQAFFFFPHHHCHEK